jgi:hypothetical protein
MAVVISRLDPQRQGYCGGRAGLLQQGGFQPIRLECVGLA